MKSKVGQQVKPYKKGGFVPFEKSSKDKEVKGIAEGSKKEMMMDKKQMKKGGKC